MNSETASRTTTVTALYRNVELARRAAEELRSVGVPARSIAMRNEDKTEVSPEEEASPGAPDRFLGALYDFLMPELDRRYYKTGLARGGTMVIVTGVSEAMKSCVVGILDREAEDIEKETDLGEKRTTGERQSIADTVGQYGGAGSATGEFDRLTGKRVGTPEGLHADEPEDPAGGSPGQATGAYDRLTGERIGTEAPGAEPEAASGVKPRRVRLYPDR